MARAGSRQRGARSAQNSPSPELRAPNPLEFPEGPPAGLGENRAGRPASVRRQGLLSPSNLDAMCRAVARPSGEVREAEEDDEDEDDADEDEEAFPLAAECPDATSFAAFSSRLFGCMTSL